MSAKQFSNHPEIDGLTLFNAPPGPHEHEVHAHDAYSVIMLTSGSKHFHHMGQTLTVSAGQIAVANPDQMHGCGPIDNKDWSHRTWYLSQTLMQELADNLGLKSDIQLDYPMIDNPALFERLIQAHKDSSEGELLDRQTAALEALTELVALHAKHKPQSEQQAVHGSNQRVKTYTEFLETRLCDPVELKDLAGLTGVQRNQVIKDFRRVTGATPGKIVREMRLSQAKQLLRDEMPLAAVASAAGFSDQSHLTRCFRSAYGLTPNEFRNLNKDSGGSAPL